MCLHDWSGTQMALGMVQTVTCLFYQMQRKAVTIFLKQTKRQEYACPKYKVLHQAQRTVCQTNKSKIYLSF